MACPRTIWIMVLLTLGFAPLAGVMQPYSLFVLLNNMVCVASLSVAISYRSIAFQALMLKASRMTYPDYLGMGVFTVSACLCLWTGYAFALQVMGYLPLAVMGSENWLYIPQAFIRYVVVLGMFEKLVSKPMFGGKEKPNVLNGLQVLIVICVSVAIAALQINMLT